MDFYPENMGNYLQVSHRKLSENANLFYEDNKSWINGLAIALAVQAVLGIISIEYSFARCKKLMYNKDEKRDEKFAPFVRLDTDRWYRFKFYPGAMFSMPIRLIILILIGIFLMIIGR